jgi:hypothetical protein
MEATWIKDWCTKVKTRRRIELLEEALLPVAQDTHIINVQFVDGDGKVANTMVFKIPIPSPPPRNRRWSRRREPGGAMGTGMAWSKPSQSRYVPRSRSWRT